MFKKEPNKSIIKIKKGNSETNIVEFQSKENTLIEDLDL